MGGAGGVEFFVCSLVCFGLGFFGRIFLLLFGLVFVCLLKFFSFNFNPNLSFLFVRGSIYIPPEDMLYKCSATVSIHRQALLQESFSADSS